MDGPWTRVAAAPPLRRGYSAETSRGGAAAATRMVRGDESRRRRGRHAESPRGRRGHAALEGRGLQIASARADSAAVRRTRPERAKRPTGDGPPVHHRDVSGTRGALRGPADGARRVGGRSAAPRQLVVVASARRRRGALQNTRRRSEFGKRDAGAHRPTPHVRRARLGRPRVLRRSTRGRAYILSDVAMHFKRLA